MYQATLHFGMEPTCTAVLFALCSQSTNLYALVASFPGSPVTVDVEWMPHPSFFNAERGVAFTIITW